MEGLNFCWLSPKNKRTETALVFLHEGLGSIPMWGNFPQLLCDFVGADGFIYEREGYGQSIPIRQKRKKDYLHVQALEVLPQVIEKHLTDRDFNLVGHSDGGSIALIYGAHNPSHRLKALVTIAAHSFVEEISLSGIRDAIEIYRKGALKARLERHHGEKTEETFFAWADTWLTPKFKEWNILDEIKEISCPCFITQGDADEYGTNDQVWETVKAIGENAESQLFNNLGHSPHRQDEIQVASKIAQFLRSASA